MCAHCRAALPYCWSNFEIYLNIFLRIFRHAMLLMQMPTGKGYSRTSWTCEMHGVHIMITEDRVSDRAYRRLFKS